MISSILFLGVVPNRCCSLKTKQVRCFVLIPALYPKYSVHLRDLGFYPIQETNRNAFSRLSQLQHNAPDICHRHLIRKWANVPVERSPSRNLDHSITVWQSQVTVEMGWRVGPANKNYVLKRGSNCWFVESLNVRMASYDLVVSL